jgi:hypothetical protein
LLFKGENVIRQRCSFEQQICAVLTSLGMAIIPCTQSAQRKTGASTAASSYTTQALAVASTQFEHSLQSSISARLNRDVAFYILELPSKFGLKIKSIDLVNLTGEPINLAILSESFNAFAVMSSIMQALGAIFYRALGKEAKEMADGNAVYMADASLKTYTRLNPDKAVIVLGDEGARDDSYSLTIGSVYYKGELHTFSHITENKKTEIHWQELRDFLQKLPPAVRVLGMVGDALEKTNGLASGDAAYIPTDSASLFTLFTNQEIKDILPLMNDKWRLAGISYFGPEAGIHALDLPSVALRKIARAVAMHDKVSEAAIEETIANYINNVTVLVLGSRSASVSKGEETDLRHEHIIEDIQKMQKRYPGLRAWTPGDGDCMPRMVACSGVSLDGRQLVVFGRSGFAEATSAGLAASNITNGHFINRFISTTRTNAARSVTEGLAENHTSEEIANYQEFSISPAIYTKERDGSWIPGPGIVAMTSVTGASAHEQTVDSQHQIHEDFSKPHFGQTFASIMPSIQILKTELLSGEIRSQTLLITERGERYIIRATFHAAHLLDTIKNIRQAHPDAKRFWMNQLGKYA